MHIQLLNVICSKRLSGNSLNVQREITNLIFMQLVNNNSNFSQAGSGIANLLVDAMVEEGLTIEKARERIFLYDINGILSKRRSEAIPDFIAHFSKDVEPSKDFAKVVRDLKPTCLIGKLIVFFECQYLGLYGKYFSVCFIELLLEKNGFKNLFPTA